METVEQFKQQQLKTIEILQRLLSFVQNGEKFGIETGLIKMEEFSLTNLATYNTFFASSFYKKDCWKKINGYDEQMIYGLEDWDFWISLLKNGGSVFKIPEKERGKSDDCKSNF